MFCAVVSPDYRLQAALRYRAELWNQPVAVVEGIIEEAADGATQKSQKGRAAKPVEPVVVELTPAAARAGVEVGMSPNQALARCMELQLLGRAAAAEESLAQTLLGFAGSISAYVEQTAQNICTLDLQGCRVADSMGWAAWGEMLVQRLESLQLRGRLGFAENPDLALLAARSTHEAQPVRVVDDAPAFLGGLPLGMLEPAPGMASVLENWGIATLGELTRLRKDDVAARLGPEGVLLWEQASGRSTRLLRLVRPPVCYEEAFDFEYELDTAQPLLFLLRRFVDQLVSRLEAVGLVAAEMRLLLPLSNGERYERLFQIPSPTANADVLFRILDTHFENLRLEHPPTGVRLTAEPAKPGHQQFRLFENAVRDPNRFAETLARIMAMVGSGNVGVPELKSTHKPDQFTLATPDFGVGAGVAPRTPPVGQSPSGVSAIGLPLRRFRPPFPARVEVVLTEERQRKPQYVVSEQAHGAVVDILGPYRISGEWWEQGWSAEEWDVQMADGGLYRLSRQGETWNVEGCYEGRRVY